MLHLVLAVQDDRLRPVHGGVPLQCQHHPHRPGQIQVHPAPPRQPDVHTHGQSAKEYKTKPECPMVAKD